MLVGLRNATGKPSLAVRVIAAVVAIGVLVVAAPIVLGPPLVALLRAIF